MLCQAGSMAGSSDNIAKTLRKQCWTCFAAYLDGSVVLELEHFISV